MVEVIGALIKEEVRKSGMTQDDFADVMGMSLRNVANLFNKEHIPYDQLIKASKVLGKDFVQAYSRYLYAKNPEIKNAGDDLGLAKEEYAFYATSVHEISFQLNIKGAFDKIQNELPSFIEIVKKEAEQRGLYLV